MFFASCKKDEVLTDKIDFTKEDIGNIIKMNFLAEYGGILIEKDYIYNLSRSHLYSEDREHQFSEDLVGANNSYFMTISGTYINNYRKSLSVYNDRFITFNSNKSKGKSSLGKYEIQIEPYTRIDIAGNTLDNKYVFSVEAYRDFEFSKGLNEIQAIGGFISFYTGACLYDYDHNILTTNTDFITQLSFYNIKVPGDRIDIKGKIVQEHNKWVFISDDGDIIAL